MPHFIQISDLHIGEICGCSGRRWIEMASILPIIGGALPHSENALNNLFAYYQGEAGDPDVPTPKLIMTGDLTSCGARTEFEYAAARMTSGAGHSAGFGVHDWYDRAIPGNHDHWDGDGLGGSKPPLRDFEGTYFANGPRTSPFFPNSETVEEVTVDGRDQPVHVRFYRLNSDRDVGAGTYNRLMAKGAFETEVERLSDVIARQQAALSKNEIRVLLVHHPFDRMRSRSRRKLLNVLDENDIRVVLCGHSHHPAIRRHAAHGWYRLSDRLEVCCGTSSQATQVDIEPLRRIADHAAAYWIMRKTLTWRHWPENPGDLETMREHIELNHHTIVAHRLEQRGRGEIFWVSDVLFWNDEYDTFLPFNQLPASGQDKIARRYLAHRWGRQDDPGPAFHGSIRVLP